MAPTIHFVAGLPRAGSTLLVNLLAQRPEHHVTPTNDLSSMFRSIRENWTQWANFRAQGIETIQPRVASALRGMAYGFYETELSEGRVVFDKNRSWVAHIELLEEVFKRPVKVVCPVRDVRAIVTSFERRHRANPLGRRSGAGPTVDARARTWTANNGLVGAPIALLRDALDRGVQDRLVIVPYRQLCGSPRRALAYVHQRLDLPPFVYDPENVEQVTQEDDTVYGWGPGLHKVRNRVEAPAETPPWADVLPLRTCRWLEKEFADVNRLSTWKFDQADAA